MDSPFCIGKRRRSHIISFFVLCLLFPGCFKHSHESHKQTYELKINNTITHVEVAFTPNDRTTGLMFRDKLNHNQGMLFMFPKERNLSFWMKNTKIPLSIAFIDSKGVITQIDSMTPYSLMSHTSKEKVKYALEMEQGWFRKNSIAVGSIVSPSPEIKSLKAE